MDFGKAIKAKRIERKMSVEDLANEVGIPVSTLYRYESKDITKIPVGVIKNICDVLDVSIAELVGQKEKTEETPLPDSFNTPEEATEFLVKLPTLAAYGGYNPDTMSDDDVLSFAQDILEHIRLLSLKYKYKDQ